MPMLAASSKGTVAPALKAASAAPSRARMALSSELSIARTTNSSPPRRASTSDSRKVLRSTRANAASARLGFIEISEPLDAERRAARTIVSDTLLTTLTLIVVCGALSGVLGLWLVGRPVRLLCEKARRIGEGDFGGPLVLGERDELGMLAAEMNATCDRLNAAAVRVDRETAARIAALEQLRHVDRLTTVGRLASGVAHELGTPLNVVAARAKMIAFVTAERGRKRSAFSSRTPRRACSRSPKTTTWVFAIDEVLWLFLQRARGARPLFDDVVRLRPWREEQIIALLRARTATTTLQPSFERLLDKLPANADEIDRQEALERRAGSYYRLLWDYAAVLPDPALFALRAVLQLAPATADEIQRATRLSSADVTEALRYAVARGYVEEEEGRYTITWTWLRALALFLQRRHLMVAQ